MNIGYTRAADPSRYGAVILAAGYSSRMNDFKPLLPVDGRPAVTGLAEMLHSAGIRDIVIVTGHQREKLQEEIERLLNMEKVLHERVVAITYPDLLGEPEHVTVELANRLA